MSQQVEEVRASVTSEWRTIAQIAGSPYPSARYEVAKRTLARMHREGLVEKSRDGNVTLWRLRA